MAGQTIGGLFKNQAAGEKALAELHAANFTSAQISEVDDEADAGYVPSSDPFADFFKDHKSTGSEFRENLQGLGMSHEDADYFEDGVARGGALVTVKADSRGAEAMAILTRNGASFGSSGAGSAIPAGTAGMAGASMARGTGVDDEQRLQLREERLSIDKVRVASGAVRIRKQVVSEKQSVDVPVSHEELVIERRPVTGGAVGGSIGDDQTITVPLSREEVRVGKETFVTEEVDIGKKAVGGTENVTDTIRHEELVVDKDEVKPRL